MDPSVLGKNISYFILLHIKMQITACCKILCLVYLLRNKFTHFSALLIKECPGCLCCAVSGAAAVASGRGQGCPVPHTAASNPLQLTCHRTRLSLSAETGVQSRGSHAAVGADHGEAGCSSAAHGGLQWGRYPCCSPWKAQAGASSW